MSLRDKILSALIVRDGADTDARRSITEQHNAARAPEPDSDPSVPPPPPVPEGVESIDIDFQGIYDAANVPAEMFTAERMLETLDSMPSQLPVQMQRQTVNMMFEAMRKTTPVSTTSVQEDAVRKISALSNHMSVSARETKTMVSTLETEIKSLLAQVDMKRRAIAGAEQKQGQVKRACQAESTRLGRVLEFLGQNDGSPGKR